MRLDHGVLNVPLAKRGNINNQLDSYKKEQEKTEKRQMEDRKFLYKERDGQAKAELKTLTRDHIKWFAKRIGVTMAEARIELKLGTPERRLKLYEVIKNG